MSIPAVVVCFLLLANSVRAGETADTSLAREVDRYLKETADVTSSPTLLAQWRNGPVFESADGEFEPSGDDNRVN